jgi:hypothetical protein
MTVSFAGDPLSVGYFAPTRFEQVQGRFPVQCRWLCLDCTDSARPFDASRGGNMAGRITNCYGRFDMASQIHGFYVPAGVLPSPGQPVPGHA